MNENILNVDGMEIFESRIHEKIQDYIIDRGIEDLSKESQQKWNACLMYVCKAIFKNTNVLKRSNYDIKTDRISSNNNAYDLDKVNTVCDIYINACMEFDKEISIIGFSFLTGINQDCIYQWGLDSNKNINRLSSKGIEIYQKLNRGREESLSDKLVSGKQNPVGILGVLNRHYGWNMGQPRTDTQAKITLSQTERAKLLEQRMQEIELKD